MECITPFTVNTKMGGKCPVPCGKCPGCFKRRVSQWSFRLQMQDRMARESCFITLTYDTKYLPLSFNGYQSLRKRDCQLFFKRLRKACSGDIKYYLVGEYGGKFARPHYHAIIFNADLGNIQPAWQLGHIHYGFVSGASIGYTLKYMCKGPWRPYSDDDDRQPQFALMSKGLGLGYLSEAMVKWHLDDPLNRMYVVLKDGKKVAMPRYYKEKLYWPSLRKAVGVVTREKMVVEQDKVFLEADDMYWRNRYQSYEAAIRRNQLENSNDGIF